MGAEVLCSVTVPSNFGYEGLTSGFTKYVSGMYVPDEVHDLIIFPYNGIEAGGPYQLSIHYCRRRDKGYIWFFCCANQTSFSAAWRLGVQGNDIGTFGNK